MSKNVSKYRILEVNYLDGTKLYFPQKHKTVVGNNFIIDGWDYYYKFLWMFKVSFKSYELARIFLLDKRFGYKHSKVNITNIHDMDF